MDTLSQTGESLLRMVHTHEGAGAAAAVLSYGTAKDRKHVVKALKGHVKVRAERVCAGCVGLSRYKGRRVHDRICACIYG